VHTNAEKMQFLSKRVVTPEGSGSIIEVDFNDITVPFRVQRDDGAKEWYRTAELHFPENNLLHLEALRLTDPKVRAREIFLEELRSYADMAVRIEQDDEPERAIEQWEKQAKLLLVLAGLE